MSKRTMTSIILDINLLGKENFQINALATRGRFKKSLMKEFGADCLDVIQFIIDVENKFDIMITEEEADKLVSLADVAKLVASKLDVEVGDALTDDKLDAVIWWDNPDL